jgi:hypothetical protein
MKALSKLAFKAAGRAEADISARLAEASLQLQLAALTAADKGFESHASGNEPISQLLETVAVDLERAAQQYERTEAAKADGEFVTWRLRTGAKAAKQLSQLYECAGATAS